MRDNMEQKTFGELIKSADIDKVVVLNVVGREGEPIITTAMDTALNDFFNYQVKEYYKIHDCINGTKINYFVL